MKDLLPLTRRQNGLIMPEPFPYFDIILILLSTTKQAGRQAGTTQTVMCVQVVSVSGVV